MFDEFDDTYPGEDVKKSPDARQQETDFTTNVIRRKVIMTRSEIDFCRSEERFPATREGVQFVNGVPVTVIEELYRPGPLGQLVRNDDVEGFSWLYKIPIPKYLLAQCPDYFDMHDEGEGPRTLCLFKDGKPVEIKDKQGNTISTIAMCSSCFKIYYTHKTWSRIPLPFFDIPI
jgi:hypothetical protein